MNKTKLCSKKKKWIYALIIMGVISCQLNDNQNKSDAKNSSQKRDLVGTWGLSNYLDSIIINKKIAKYRLQPPSWFGILLEIKKDSIYLYGSLMEVETELINKEDTVAILNSFEGGWMLLRNQNNLLLKQFPYQENLDTSIYIYRQRTDLKEMTKNLDRVHKISSNVTKYFNKEILYGTYIDQMTNNKVEFLETGKLKGIDGFSEYEIRNYFGTLHPYKNKDVLFLRNRKEDSIKQFNWKFEGDILILREFVHEMIQRNGEDVLTDYFVLGDEIIILKKET